MHYQKIGNSYFGFSALTISDVSKYCPEFFSGMSMLITCLDSTSPVSRLHKWIAMLSQSRYSFEEQNNGVVIFQEDVARILDDGRTFIHFDEVYLFAGTVPRESKFNRVFTTDGVNFSEEIPDEFIQHFGYLGATRYLSDGCGLNFVCDSNNFVQALGIIERQQTGANEQGGNASCSPTEDGKE